MTVMRARKPGRFGNQRTKAGFGHIVDSFTFLRFGGFYRRGGRLWGGVAGWPKRLPLHLSCSRPTSAFSSRRHRDTDRQTECITYSALLACFPLTGYEPSVTSITIDTSF